LDHAALDEIIRNRRTIKPPMMSDRPVAEEDLRAILENANWACGFSESIRSGIIELLPSGIQSINDRW
jgi:nitroreductase